MTQFVEQLRNQAKWYTQPGHNARDLMDSHLLEKAADEIERLRAKIEQSAPDGWKLVPIEPTQEMINHVIDKRLDALVAGKDHTFIDIYKAMLAAAPEAKP